jgi:hypothetical protein
VYAFLVALAFYRGENPHIVIKGSRIKKAKERAEGLL